jgi:hypothetical protein
MPAERQVGNADKSLLDGGSCAVPVDCGDGPTVNGERVCPIVAPVASEQVDTRTCKAISQVVESALHDLRWRSVA